MPGEEPRTFDSFEWAIHALAPTYEHCGVVIGHGVEADGSFSSAAPVWPGQTRSATAPEGRLRVP